MGSKIALTRIDKIPKGKKGSFPASWQGVFDKQPKAGEVEQKKAIIQKIMNEDKDEQVRKGECSPGFKLAFTWKRTNNNPVTYKLEVDTELDKRFKDGDGTETPPQPKSPPPPPK
jgi:hypothetical protein